MDELRCVLSFKSDKHVIAASNSGTTVFQMGHVSFSRRIIQDWLLEEGLAHREGPIWAAPIVCLVGPDRNHMLTSMCTIHK